MRLRHRYPTLVALATVVAVACTTDTLIGPKDVAILVIAPDTVIVPVNDTILLQAVATDSRGLKYVGERITWSSSNPSVATISPVGTLITLSVGNTTITASAGGKSASAQVTVTPPPTLTLSVDSLGFAAVARGPVPAAQQVVITNTGGGGLTGITPGIVTYVGPDTGWLSIAQNSVTAPDTILLTVTLDTFPVGTYTAIIPFSAPKTTNGPQTLKITLTLGAGVPTQVIVAAGDTQTATVKTGVPVAPAVLVKDAFGNLIPGVSVTFATTASNGTLTGALATTNAAGLATVGSWTLDSVAKGDTLTATVAALPAVTFTATGRAAAAAQVLKTAGDGQSVAAGSALPAAPTVTVKDQYGNDVVGATVTFAATASNGTITGASTTTSAAGTAAVGSWTLGTAAKTDSLTATVTGVGAPALFTATATPGAATTIAKSAGGTTGTVNADVAPAPTVIVADQFGNPVQGVAVTFAATAANGAVTGGVPTTNAAGVAAVGSWKLATTARTDTLTATSGALAGSPVTFVVVASAGAATTMVKDSGDAQTVSVGSAVPVAPAALVRDAFNNPVAGVGVTFAVTLGGGSVLPATPVLTNAGGVASATSWHVGSAAGANALSASAAGLTPVTFNATATVGAATTIARLGSAGQTDTIGAVLPIPDSVLVTDQFSNPVAGVTVTWSAGSGGTLTPGAATTNGAGVATATRILGTGPGLATDTAKAAGLAGSPVLFSTTTNAGHGATLVKGTGDGQTDTVGATLAIAYTDTVKDRAGNPVSGVTVTWAAAGGGSIPPSSITGANGVATAIRILGTTPGVQTATATVAGLAGSPVGFSATATHGAAKIISVVAGTDSQAATVSTSVAPPPSVKVTDQFGNPVSGVTISFALGTGGARNGSITGAAPATSPAGIATLTSWTLGATAGPDTVIATAAGLTGSPVTFVDFGNTGGATTITLAGGNNQTDTVRATLTRLDSVLVTDGVNPVSNHTVTWAVTKGGGTITPSSMSNANGIAVAQWVLGDTAGAQNATATAVGLAGSPVLFSATATHGAPASLTKNGGDAQTAAAGTAVATSPSVLVKDQFNNPVPGLTVTFAPVGATNGGVTGGTPATSAGGIATVGSWTLGNTAKTDSLTASAGALTPVTFTATTTAAGATTIARLGSAAQSDTIGATLAIPDSAKVTDQFGNPVAGVTVTWVAGGAGTLTPTGATTNGAGIATATRTVGTTVGVVTDTAKAGGLTGSPVLFTATTTAGQGATLIKGAGDAQTDTVGATLATAYTDTVKDRAGNVVQGVTVTWGVTGGGSVTPTSITGANGVATATRVLGTVAGPQGATGTVAGLAGSPVSFTATADHGAAKLLTAVAGTNGQSATVSTPVGTPPSVKVTDQFANPVSGVAVTYALGAGAARNGVITGTSQVTNGSGVAPLTSWTLGATAGSDTVIATSAGLTGSPVIFVDFGNSGAATTMSLAGGNNQTDTVLATLPHVDSVLVTDGTNPISGVTVAWAVTSGGGTIPPTSLTNGNGIAVAQWVLGSTAGTQNSTASVGGLLGSPVTFTATATHGAAKTIAVNAGNGQSATVGAALATAPSVIVKDSYGNVVSGVAVTFAATARNGSVTGAGPVTNAGGIATVGSWTIGTIVGPDTMTATSGVLTGSPVLFTATGTTGAATNIARLGSAAQSDTIGATLAILDSVKVTDQFANPVSGVAVTWGAGDAGSLTPTSGTTNALGIATATRILGNVVGAFTDTAKSTGLTGSPITFSATVTAGHAASLVKGTGDSQSDTVGATLPIAYTDSVLDRAGNPVSGVTVTWGVAGGGSITPSSISGANGVATATRVLGTTVGAPTATGTAAGLAGSPVNFSATATHGTAKIIAMVAGTNGQGATVGTAVTLPPAAKVTDQFGNAVSGATVTFALGAGGARNGSLTVPTPSTDLTGVATLGSWTLGAFAGPDTVTATAAGLTGSPLTYVDNGSAGSATTLAAAGGNGQTDTVLAILPHLDSVLVTDGVNPVSGVTVAWAVISGGGSIPPSSITNANGIAVAQWTLGNTAGLQQATATSGSLAGSPVTFSATATHGAAKTIAVNAGNAQTATVNATLGTAPSVIVKDAYGNVVPGVAVTFALGAGGARNGSITGASPSTDGSGVAAVGSWKIGTIAGPDTITAAVGGLTGSPVIITATGTADVPFSMSASAGTGQAATEGTAVTTPPAVLVVDQFSNPVSGVSVTFAPATVASGSVTGGSATTDLTGTATVISWTMGSLAKTDTLIATSGGLSPVSFFATATPGAPATLAKAGGDAQTDTVKAKLAALTVLVTDGGANPVSGVTVNWLVTSGSGSLALASSITNGAGIAADTVTFGTASGPVSVQASSGVLTPVSFSATANPGNPTTLVKNGGDGQNATVNTSVATAPSVKVTDQFGNPVNGVAITFAIGSGGGSLTGATPTTAANGIATLGSWTLGTAAGANSLTATATGFAGGGNPATFTGTGTAGAVSASLSTVTAGTASITACSSACVVGTTASTITVTAVDQFSNPINGAPVTISATGSGNTFAPASGNTNSSGVLVFTFNSTQALAKTVTAVVSGVTITQQPAVTVTPAAVSLTTSTLAVTSASMTACSSGCVVGSTAVTVTEVVRDQFSNLRPGSSTGLSATGTVNTFAPASGVTDGTGTFTSTFNATLIGLHTITATANGSPITQTQGVTVTAAAAASIAVNAGNNQTVRVNTAVPILPSVIVKDAFGNVNSGVTVTFAVATGGGSGTGLSTSTAGTGIATVGSWTVQAAVAASGTGTHSNTMTATATGFAGGGNPVTFTAQGIYTLSGDAQPIFTASCVSCHGGGGNAPNLTAGTTHSTTVGIASTCTSGTRIVAGSASTSILFLRMQGSSCGVMPPGGAIAAAQQNIVRDWINNGAQAN